MKPVILDILRTTRQSQIKRPELLSMLRAKGVFTTDRAMRKCIEELIDDGECIASSENGYFMITDPSQILATVTYLKKKSKSIAMRGNKLIRNWEQKHPDVHVHLTLFPED